jgi:hypothetical protein
LGLVCSIVFAGIVLGEPEEEMRLQDGMMLYSTGHYLEGQPIPLGYDIYGYNYQAHLLCSAGGARGQTQR